MKSWTKKLHERILAVTNIWPGFFISGIVAVAAQFLSDQYGAPAMLMALLLGLVLGFLAEENGKCLPGIRYASTTILRLSIAFLGARISLTLFASIGLKTIGLIIAAIAMTVVFGLVLARLLGRGWRLALLTGGAVSICGASAALAIAAVLPRNQFSEKNLSFTVFSVTTLSTIAMVVYPIIARFLDLNDADAGLFLGGAIHDVAQVIGAGFTLSDSIGETATTIKLIRVTMLAPFILLLTLIFLRLRIPDAGVAKPLPIVPGFIIVFFGLVLLNSLGVLSATVQNTMWSISKWAMLAAIAAVGMKTELRQILNVPFQYLVLVLSETLFIALFVLGGSFLL